MIVSGTTQEHFNIKDFVSGERKSNPIADIPIRYEKLPKYKHSKQEEKDLKIVAREKLIKILITFFGKVES